MYGWRARIGYIMPSSGTVVDAEWVPCAPKGVIFVCTRALIEKVNVDGVRHMTDQYERAAKELASAEVSCIIQAGTPAGFIGNPGWDRELGERLTKLTGIPTVTMMTACIEALRELGLKRIVVATPYVDELNVKLKATLEGAGFEVLAFKGLGVLRNIDINKLPPEAAYQTARDVYRQAPQADGIFISCGGWPTFENIPLLEHDLGVPVVSSNSAGMWMGFKLAGLPPVVPGLGRLFQESRVPMIRPSLKRVSGDAG